MKPLVKCQCSECDCHTKTVEHPCSNCQGGRHANFSIWDGIEQERKEMTPESGYNVCLYDSYAPFGENLTLIEHFEDQSLAIALRDSIIAKGEKAYVFGSKDVKNS